jgi:hypothetical protein
LKKWELFQQMEDLLRAIAPKILLTGLSGKLDEDAEATELEVLTDVLATFNPTTTEVRTSVSEELRRKLHGYLKRAVDGAAQATGMNAGVRADLALVLAQVGGPEDMPDLRRLIEADLIRYRNVQTARLRGERSSDMSGYMYPLIGAVTMADPKGADGVLLELLEESEYERPVVETLVQRARKKVPGIALEANRMDFTKIWKARAGKESEEFIEKRRRWYADAIRGVVERLLKEREAATDKRMVEYRLKIVGNALAALDAKRSVELLLDVMELPGRFDVYHRVATLESLVTGGVPLARRRRSSAA